LCSPFSVTSGRSTIWYGSSLTPRSVVSVMLVASRLSAVSYQLSGFHFRQVRPALRFFLIADG
jgi:hypothetical protein